MPIASLPRTWRDHDAHRSGRRDAHQQARLVTVWTILVAGLVNAHTKLIRDGKLHNATPPRVRAPLHLGWTEFTSGRFQTELERRLEESWGFRGWLIVTDNSLHYWLLRETRHGKPVVVGRDGVLFSREDITYVNRTDVCVACDDVAARLGRAQRRLLASGRLVLPILVPAKTTIERAALPDRWRRSSGAPRSDEQVYGRMVAALTRERVIFIDARARLLALRAETGRPVFPPEGRHWNFYAACLVYTEAMRVAASRLSVPIVATDTPACEPAMTWKRSLTDLKKVMNVWGYRNPPWPPLPAPATRRDDLRPLLVGTSFLWDFSHLLHLSTFGHGARFNYYNDSIFTVADQDALGKVDPTDPDWVRWTLSRNLYVVDLFEGFLPETGYRRFLDQLETILSTTAP